MKHLYRVRRVKMVERACFVKGIHAGKDIKCQREPQNSNDCYILAVLSNGMIIGHLRRISIKHSLLGIFNQVVC